jgi:hypothetical protein
MGNPAVKAAMIGTTAAAVKRVDCSRALVRLSKLGPYRL